MRTIMIIVTMFCCGTVMAQKVRLGLRDNDNAFVCYEGKSQWYVGFDHTVHADGAEGQTARFAVGLREKKIANGLDATVVAWGGTSWKNTYTAVDGLAILNYHPCSLICLKAGGGLHRDSGIGTDGMWNVGMVVHAFRDVSFVAEMTNRVVYRQAEPRSYIGLDFHSGNLMVAPRLSIPLDENIRYSRVSISFVYDIAL